VTIFIFTHHRQLLLFFATPQFEVAHLRVKASGKSFIADPLFRIPQVNNLNLERDWV
jgi:hypothetical protein